MEKGLLARETGPSLAFISTYPPTMCGLANFTHSLYNSIISGRGHGSAVSVIRILTPSDNEEMNHLEVQCSVNPDSHQSIKKALHLLKSYDVVLLQHEYSIYGRNCGEGVLHFLENISTNVLVTLHTIRKNPTYQQRTLITAIAQMANGIVVMSDSALKTLESQYPIDMQKVHLIPHGAHCFNGREGKVNNRPMILTWGLLGPGKGIEWGIRALSYLKNLNPRPLYRISGIIHPNDNQLEGVCYMNMLITLAELLGVTDMIEITNTYMSNNRLAQLIRAADMILLPYDCQDQVTSGVLVEAIAACKPVVATKFPHATELLSDGAGLLVPFKSPRAIAESIRCLMKQPIVPIARWIFLNRYKTDSY